MLGISCISNVNRWWMGRNWGCWSWINKYYLEKITKETENTAVKIQKCTKLSESNSAMVVSSKIANVFSRTVAQGNYERIDNCQKINLPQQHHRFI